MGRHQNVIEHVDCETKPWFVLVVGVTSLACDSVLADSADQLVYHRSLNEGAVTCVRYEPQRYRFPGLDSFTTRRLPMTNRVLLELILGQGILRYTIDIWYPLRCQEN